MPCADRTNLVLEESPERGDALERRKGVPAAVGRALNDPSGGQKTNILDLAGTGLWDGSDKM
jgi:hypothetical protein